MDKEQTIALLKDCSAGCKMALDNIHQILQYVDDKMLEHSIHESRDAHEKIEKKVRELLHKMGENEKEPPMIASAFSKLSTDVKIMMNGASCQIAKLLIDGCNMGIQSISESKNENSDAEKEALDLAEKLIQEEESFMKKLRVYL